MKMIKIDAEHQRLTVIDADENNTLKAMQDAVGGTIATALTINDEGKVIDTYDDGSTIFVDDEGLFKGHTFGFEVAGGHQPFLGNGVVAGVDSDGETISPSITIEQLEKVIKWLVFVAH